MTCLSLISDFNREAELKTRFGSISRLGSGRQVKRSVKNTCCVLCGDVKYTPPPHKKLAHAYKTRSWHRSRLEQTMVRPVAPAKMTTRLIIWFRRHLKVTLCDVGHVFDMTSRDFSCILPAVLLQKRKHKRVKCFRKEFKSLVCLDPQGSGIFRKGIGNQCLEVSTPTNSCTSFSSGNQVLGFSAGEHNSDVTEYNEDWSKSLEKQNLSMEGCERKRVSPVKWTTCVPLNHGKVQRCTETAGSSLASEVQEVKAASVQHVPPLLLRRVRACNCFASSRNVQNVDSCDNVTVSEPITKDNCLVKNGLNDDSEKGEDSFYFSCQRTTAYMAWARSSCARTYKSWPFPRHGPPSEIKLSVRTGPRWIVTTEVLKGSTNLTCNTRIDSDRSSERTDGNSMKEHLIGFEPPDGSVVIPNGQGQVQSTVQNMRVLASPTLEETSKDQPKCQKSPAKGLPTVSHEGDHMKQSSNMFQRHSPNLSSAHRNGAQAVDIRPKKLDVIPAGSVCTLDTKSVDLDLGDSSMNRTQSSMPYKCLENNETVTEATIFHHPDLKLDLLQSDSQTVSCIRHTREEPQTPNKTADQNAASLTDSGSSILKTNSDSFSSNDEDLASSSLVERPEEGDGLSLQCEMCETGEAIRSPADLPVGLGSVVTEGNLDVVRAYEEDAIVLDVIQDDPDLFGAIGVVTTRKSASNAQPAAVQWGKSMCRKTDQTTLVKKNNRIVWDLKSARYVDVYKQAHFLYIMKLVF